jgi:PAS domain S-box-containing protein
MQMADDSEFYRAVLDSVMAGVYLVDKTGRILFWNTGAEKISGYLRQEILGRSALHDFLGHLDPDNNPIDGELLPVSIALRDGKDNAAQVSIRHKSGNRILTRLHAAPIRDRVGRSDARDHFSGWHQRANSRYIGSDGPKSGRRFEIV